MSKSMSFDHCRYRCIIAVLLAIAAASQLCASDNSAQAKETRFFETRIRPLLAAKCFRCHGPKRQRGDLRLDSRQAILRGGASGESAFVPGEPEKSLLIKAISHQHKLKMPPNGKLNARDITDLTRWVRAGAVFPDAVTVAKDDEKHWAFQPAVDPPVPAVRNRDWPRSALDRFILAALEAKGLCPAPPADKRTLIRRATFDLIGLPPSPKEVSEFLADSSPDAFAKVVDRLLASPHYGERWGRHWLDVARYADSNGLDENVAYGNAWRYRDYVVSAFNRDKPYDQFLLEQIAGDLLPATDEKVRHERLIATGFLALGPKVLAEVDAKKMEMDILDEQIDTLGRSVMGLTMGCARCHNHKFDPITMGDYYGLAGIFQSTKTMESFKKIGRWHENSLAGKGDLARKAAHQEKVNRHKTVIKELVRSANDELKASLVTGKTLPKKPEKLYPAETRRQLKNLRDELTLIEKSAPVMPSALGVTEGQIGSAKILQRGDHLTPGNVTPRRFPVFLAGSAQKPLPSTASGRLELARWLIRKDHPLTSRVMVNRLWRWHYGRGLVKTTDNFGRLGARPSNQALLDWLAHRFAENGWSIKKMHRLIMLSATYQMSSAHNADAAKVDPENSLHWRANIRRLQAESIRDALLAASGLLDKKMGGSLLHIKNREYFFNHTSKDQTNYDSLRRSLYLPVVRNNLYDVYQLFDAPDGTVLNGNRATTTVATQALFMLNSELMDKASKQLARSLLARSDLDYASRIRSLYQKAYGRPPSTVEINRARIALVDFEKSLQARESDVGVRRRHAWTWLCHVVLAANEFVYIN